MNIFLLFTLILLLNTATVQADGVLGCGGFVKSDVDINFSLVEVKLYTPHWSIKYQTDCAPNTGYYLIPLYDKGDFILKVEPPQGWTFEPESVELHVDGEKDKCSLGEDINFVFTGFSLVGKVISKGQVSGPAGVTVSLYKSGSKDVLQSVTTAEDGSYQFKKIMPGKYDIKATQDQFRFEKSEISIDVTSDNADAGSSLVIAGYGVSGKVFSEGEPVMGVNFLLYSSIVNQKDVLDCDKSAVAGIGKTEKLDPLCHVKSDSTGKFTFPCLATGDYFLVPFYKGEHITFDVKPEKLPFQVSHGPLNLETTFQVAGFSVSGRVLDSVKGSGISKAEVLLNGKPVTSTGPDGVYHLENMKTNMYKLHVKVDNIFFDEQEIRITPNTPQLPDIVPTSFNICGRVTIDKFPDSLSQQITKRKLIIFPEGKGSAAVSKETNEEGKFCTAVKPGKYIVRVHLSDAETKAGLTIAPVEQLVTVASKPVLDVTFSQFRAKVTGTITCMEKCGPMEVSLDAVGRMDKQITQTQTSQNTASFTFDNVLPGKYKATIMRDSLCWKAKTIDFEVGSSNVDNLQFLQTGYILKCTISHPITLNFAQEKKEGSVGSFELNKGKNRFCLAQPGIYQLTPDSCHKFEKDVYTYDTGSSCFMLGICPGVLQEVSELCTHIPVPVIIPLTPGFKESLNSPLTPFNPAKKPDSGILKSPASATTGHGSSMIAAKYSNSTSETPVIRQATAKVVAKKKSMATPVVSIGFQRKKATPITRKRAADFFL
ncbi:nodal modulator 2-like [Mercenaria mercenaria]|uniref:nodal modulator 2-like n=1 Tax=Mercenaria mercenaria TaxID=6596 RepID=UPI00234FAB4D|nr:nodal modulator 2-like [Mercenaria mercenaria]